MKNKFLTTMRISAMLLCTAAMTFTFTACEEEISTESRYTFTGNTVASYLEENADFYSSFIEILKRGGRFSMLEAYGTYTCFAPTNDAIAKYLYEQDSIYWNTKDTDKPIDTHVYSTELSELSDSMCQIIAQTHILPEIYLSTDMEGDIIPTMNLNDRYLSVAYEVNEESKPVMIVNGSAEIIERDEEVENGVVHALNNVLIPSSNTVPAQIANYDYFSIFAAALEETKLTDRLQDYKDYSYNYDGTLVPHFDKGNTTTCPLDRYYGFSAFVEPDSIFEANGIDDLEELKERCKEWYPNATDEDPESPNNALNQFISYHLINKKVIYARLTCTDLKLNDGFNSEKNLRALSDRTEYYETFNNVLMKITIPRSKGTHINTPIINYASNKDMSANNPDMENHININVIDPNTVKEQHPDFDQVALNGIIHVIDKILVYNEDEMAGNVLNGIMRFDFSALMPELTNNEVRWCSNGKAGAPLHGKNEYCLITAIGNDGNYFESYDYKSNYVKVNTKETRLYYLCPTMSWRNYQGDEMMALGAYDFAYKLPPVPAGTYEIRMGYSMSGKRGVVQFYIDDEVTGIPIDLRKNGGDPIVGWESDASTDDNGVANDKAMKNRGYLKGPTSYFQGGSLCVRDDIQSLRKVITTKYLTSGVDHWIRFKNVMKNDDGTAQMMHDYLEIVPMTFVRSEDVSLADKRK